MTLFQLTTLQGSNDVLDDKTRLFSIGSFSILLSLFKQYELSECHRTMSKPVLITLVIYLFLKSQKHRRTSVTLVPGFGSVKICGPWGRNRAGYPKFGI